MGGGALVVRGFSFRVAIKPQVFSPKVNNGNVATREIVHLALLNFRRYFEL